MPSIISIHHLTKKYGDFTAVNDISFDVQAGEIFAFL
jgi:ABC-type multidrug transport system ATPase subunit